MPQGTDGSFGNDAALPQGTDEAFGIDAGVTQGTDGSFGIDVGVPQRPSWQTRPPLGGRPRLGTAKRSPLPLRRCALRDRAAE